MIDLPKWHKKGLIYCPSGDGFFKTHATRPVPYQLNDEVLRIFFCSRDDDEWGPDIICQLAHYTLESVLNPGETMDIGPAAPDGSTIAAFLFCDYGRFKVRDRPAGLLLCLGITAQELSECRSGNRTQVESAIKDAGVYPFTDLFRKSVL